MSCRTLTSTFEAAGDAEEMIDNESESGAQCQMHLAHAGLAQFVVFDGEAHGIEKHRSHGALRELAAHEHDGEKRIEVRKVHPGDVNRQITLGIGVQGGQLGNKVGQRRIGRHVPPAATL